MEGLNRVRDLRSPDDRSQGNPQVNQFLYLSVKTETGQSLSSALFAKDVIEGMLSLQKYAMDQQQTSSLGVMLLSDTEAVVELSERVNMERTIAIMMPLQFWLGQKVKVECRAASPDEIECAQRREENPEGGVEPDNHETRFLRMVKDIHRLAVSSHGDALRIPTFSGSIPPNKNEVTFFQWIHEVRDALTRFPIVIHSNSANLYIMVHSKSAST